MPPVLNSLWGGHTQTHTDDTRHTLDAGHRPPGLKTDWEHEAVIHIATW